MSDEPHPAIPASMRLAWGLRDRPQRGPKPGRTLDAIVAAGIELATREGLAAVSMSRVASEVGVSTMALYRYVEAKDDLLEIMVDTALGLPPPRPAGETWRAGLLRWALGVRDAYRVHPWTLQVPITAPPLGPNNVRWLEDGLASLAPTSLLPQQRVHTVIALSAFVRGSEGLHQDIAAAQEPGEPDDYVPALRSLIDPETFPNLAAALAAGGIDGAEEAEDDDFDYGLARLLDGIEALMRAQRPRRRR